MNYTPKAERAFDVLRELIWAGGTISVHDKPEWTTAGNTAHSSMIKLLAKEGAIDTETTVGRNGGSVHTITDVGQWLYLELQAKTLTRPFNWKKDAEYVKWSLLLPDSEHRLNGIRSQMLQDCERIALTEAWKGSAEHQDVIEQYGSNEAKAILRLTRLIPGELDLSIGSSTDETFDVLRRNMAQETGLSFASLQRIGEIMLYKLLTQVELSRDN